jgi:glycyl-tRNA synthetase beta chain
MPDLLLELFSEEIPARMQTGAAKDLERLVVGALTDRGFLFEGIKAFAGPRRLTLAISGLPAKQRDVREELKGPKVDAPQTAIDGFLKKTGLTKTQLKVEKTPKGDVYIAVIERAGRDTAEVLAEILPDTLPRLLWPKSMRWPQNVWMDPMHTIEGAIKNEGETIKIKVGSRWVRPLRSIVCTFDGQVVPFEFAGVKSGNTTTGHRFLSQGALTVRRFDDYEAALKKAHVVLDAEERKAIIFEGVKGAAFVHGLEMIPDEGLLNEVAGLVEYPVILIGAIPEQFMDVPAEILQTSMRTHQKYFSLRDPKTGKMANRFALVANMIAEDGGKEIVAGNERVLRARLSDAKFFWDADRKVSLDTFFHRLSDVVFHAKAGRMSERVDRIILSALTLAHALGANVSHVNRASNLCKVDLVTGLVGEFPELQGVVGRYYALAAGEKMDVADAIRDHYKPMGPGDEVPSASTSYLVALGDKIDSLVTLWRVGERPTGSKDPFAQRRAALGIIRIILENRLRINLRPLIAVVIEVFDVEINSPWEHRLIEVHSSFRLDGFADEALTRALASAEDTKLIDEILEFLADRLKVALKEKGIRHDLIDAVFALGHEDDLVRLVARVEALQAFLKTDDGTNLLAGYKRAANILKLEEKKDGKTYISEVHEGLLAALPEKNLYAALEKAKAGITPALEKEDFAAAMRQMASLRGPVDGFFDGVKVNDENHKLRENRLNLLAALRAALHQVADFSRIES